MRKLGLFVLLIATMASAESGLAQGYPAPKEGDWIAKDFPFHTGEVMPELRIHYTTIGAPTGEPVLVLHGTTMSGTAMLAPIFAGELFGPGQALDGRVLCRLPAGHALQPAERPVRDLALPRQVRAQRVVRGEPGRDQVYPLEWTEGFGFRPNAIPRAGSDSPGKSATGFRVISE